MNKKFLAAFLFFINTFAWAQQNVEFVIPFAQGGTADKLALILLGPLKTELSQVGITPVLTYKPGGGSTLATNYVAKSSQVKIFLAPNAVVTAPIVNRSIATYNVDTDLVPLEFIGHLPMLLVTNSQSDLTTIKELQRQCHQRNITYGSAGIGSATHIASVIALNTLGCPGTHVPYKGVGPALIDLQGNHISIVTDFEASIRPYIDSRIFRPLLSLSRSRNSDFPRVPSMADIGVPNFDFYNWFIIAVNSSAPQDDITKVQAALKRVMLDKDLQRQLHEVGFQGIGTPITKSFLANESTKFEKIINKININGLSR
jgi:tripartite-type tricarboxylate transporter receptor subunit TctC